MVTGLAKLPGDLQNYVKEDNLQFERELKVWDMLQARKAHQEKQALASAAAAAAAATTTTAAHPAGTGTGTESGAGAGVGKDTTQTDSTGELVSTLHTGWRGGQD